MTAPIASDACLKPVKCAGKSEKGCGVMCRCKKAKLSSSTELCKYN